MQKLTVPQIFLIFLKLGLTSFGGPVAHLGYFREEFVNRRKCLKEESYADIVALCQFLPGPASSQVGISIGLSQAGIFGGLAAWTGFTLPSAFALVLFAYGISGLQETVVEVGWLHGLKVVAVAVVAQAIWGMTRALCPDWPRKILALLAAVIAVSWEGISGQLLAMVVGALFGRYYLHDKETVSPTTQLSIPNRKVAIFSLGLFLTLFLTLPLLSQQGSQVLALFDSFYRSGALVFGGGHVVLPLLQAEVVTPGWISKDLFLAGYGAAQAVPGPLFTFAAYLGAALQAPPNGWSGGLICLLAIFLPSFLLVVGILPFWETLRKKKRIRSALIGINAAVVGLLLAAFYDPVWSSGILSIGDFVLALIAFGLLTFWKLPPWLVVGATGVGGFFLSLFF
ncbi:chromate efflux transporter [uncultured Desulfuromusa sp.]|uniref:chromate efflux transporter n=1 Tax=uncultured Desulfuromusa sp. TaxID=219183 RepID=UPI002AA62370|nr:chromate efflux transporter [uncultured Desulfuromusa sp.]